LLLILIELVNIPFKPGSSNKRFVRYKVGSDVIAHSIKLIFNLSGVIIKGNTCLKFEESFL